MADLEKAELILQALLREGTHNKSWSAFCHNLQPGDMVVTYLNEEGHLAFDVVPKSDYVRTYEELVRWKRAHGYDN